MPQTREERTAYQRAYRKAHKEQIAAYYRVYHERHQEKLNAYARQYYVDNTPACAARSLATRIALGQTLPAGYYLAHCGAWQAITALPYACTACGERFFVPEEQQP